MFTGIVEELGEVVAVEQLAGDAARLVVRGPVVTADAGYGDSIAVNGVCLTVTEHAADTFAADVMRETLLRSCLAELVPGSPVNLERPVTLATRLGGHLVQGHVDGTGRLVAREPAEHWEVVRVSLPVDLARYVVAKGSITVDGVSLTVVDVGQGEDGPWFSVSLIPTTLSLTTLGRKGIGDAVNLEVDVVAKYVERLMGWRTA
ncbi:MAG: riboflavin synthase [Actinomycetota bacterium]|nr:MAG: riboflavin synthase [Actinomycetota bacterium]